MTRERLTRTERELLGEIVTECIENGFSVKLINSETVDLEDSKLEGLSSSGFFDPASRVLAVAIGKSIDKWIPLLVHEFNHFLQWLNNPKKAASTAKSYELLWKCVSGDIGNMSEKRIRKNLLPAIQYELECERATVNMLLAFDIPIDITSYIKGANSQLYFYSMIAKYKEWYIIPPYEVPELVSLMPIALQRDYSILPSGAEELYVKNCFEEEKTD